MGYEEVTLSQQLPLFTFLHTLAVKTKQKLEKVTGKVTLHLFLKHKQLRTF